MYPRGNGLDWWSTVFSGGVDPFFVLEDLRVGWYMKVGDLHMSCGLEFPAGL